MNSLKPQILILTSLLMAPTTNLLRAEDAVPLPGGQVGIAYEFKIQTDGGLAPFHWAVKSGTLPPGLEIRYGVISGSPTQAQANAYQFTLEVSDSSQPPQSYSQSFSLIIKAAPLRILLSSKPLKMIINASSVSSPGAPDPPPAGSPDASAKGEGGQKPPAHAPGPAPAPAPAPAPGQAVTVSVSPPSASLQTGGTLTVKAKVTNAPDDSVIWSVNGTNGGNASVGKIDSKGVYTAPSAAPDPATVKITATSKADTTKSASMDVTITSAPADQATKDKTAASACFAVSPGWFPTPAPQKPTNPAPPESRFETPITVTSCDSPAKDISQDTVTLDDAKTPGQPPRHVELPRGCESPASSELVCTLSVDSSAQHGPHILKVYSDHKLISQPLTIHIGDPNHYWIGMAGFDITGSSSGPQQQWFAAANLMQRLVAYDSNRPHSGLWAWLDVKLGSIPTAKTSALSSLGSASTVASNSGIQNVSDITQSIEFRGGLAPSIHSKTVSLLLGFGAVSPINSISGAQEYNLSTNLYNQFANNTQLQGQYPQLWQNGLPCYATPAPSTGCSNKPTTVAFVLPSRSRFYRDYFGGFRLWFGPRNNGTSFPGRFDITVGQDETVTGARFHGAVFTLLGDYPLDSNGLVRIFGSAHMRIARNVNTPTLDMAPATSFVDPTTSAVVIQQTNPLDRDYFRVGLGFDISEVFSALKSKAPTSSTAPKTAPAP